MPDLKPRSGRYNPDKYDRDRQYAYALKSLYGLMMSECDAMFVAQDGRCAACGGRSERRLCVDHNHGTGAVRGLLCHSCNMTLGRYEENAGAFDSYRERYA